MIGLSNCHHRIILKILYHNCVREELYFVATSMVSYLIDGEKVCAKSRNMENICEASIFQLNVALPFYVHLSIISHIDVRYM